LNQHRRLYFSIFILICFLLALLFTQSSALNWLDAQMFRVASHLIHVEPHADNFRTIKLDEASLHSPEGLRDLRLLLRKMRKSRAAEIIWLTDDIPQVDYIRSEKKAAKSKKSASAKEDSEKTEWQPTEGERSKLARTLEKLHVFLTEYASSPNIQTDIPYSASLHHQRGWRQYIPGVFLPQAKTFRISDSRLPYRVYPFDSLSREQLALIWYDQTRTFTTPDLSLAVFTHSLKSRKLHWDEQGSINLDTLKIPAGLSGKVYGYFSALTGRHVELNELSLQQAYQKPASWFKKRMILLGQDKDQLQALADSLASLNSNATYYTPTMSWWLTPLVLLVVSVYLLLIVPLMSRQGGIFLGAFLILSLIVAQTVVLIVDGIWWPAVSVLLLMLVGHYAVYIYTSGKEVLNGLIQKQNDAWFQLGHYQYEKGDYDKALTSLLKCAADEDVLSDLYEIALSFERKRQYDRALQLYSEINIRSKNYRDVSKRIKSMSGLSETRAEIPVSLQSQQTLVMPQLEMPEFGRYKIEKELGRGAMGVVYLGKDPKINRQVAIKTLDYAQFSSKELKVVKSRFFREAEAAGRLSHHNIVTVYDVGEEDDFAFIAMDYVTGVALSEYTSVDNLLPVDEVYRIIQEVADTLDYAHSQNIVHRDIKPGNIMYNPQDRQIKITDFGIARITDSVKTRTGSFMGSPSYMAPEQMTGTHVDGRADLYALGVSFYQLLCGRLPFDADSLGNLAYKITNEKHTPIRDIRSDLPASATRIINKALQKKPEKRYATGKEMSAAIKRGMPAKS